MLLVERSGFGLNELLGAKPGAVSHELLTCEKRQAAIQAPAEQRRQPDNWAVAIVEVNRVDVNPKRGKHGKSNQCAKPELANVRSEEHTSELQSLMRISYAVFCLKKKKNIESKTKKT